MRKIKRYFTLIELIVVIAIIAVLAAVIAPNALRVIEKSKIAKAKSNVVTIKKANSMLYADTGKYLRGCPAFVETFNTEVKLDGPEEDQIGLMTKPSDLTDYLGCQWTQDDLDAWDGPYLESGSVVDPWGIGYEYDGDFAFCDDNANVSVCSNDSWAKQVCDNKCPAYDCYPPVILSHGPDNIRYSCDSIVVSLE